MNNLSQKAMLVSLTLGSWGATKSDRDLSRELVANCEAEDGSLMASKRIVNKRMLKSVKNIDLKIRNTFNEVTLPWSAKSHILPIQNVWTVRETIYKLFDERSEKVEEFLSWYARFLDENSVNFHGTAYNPDDFPTVEEVRSKFHARLDFAPVGEVTDFRNENPDIEKLVSETAKFAEEEVSKTILRRVISKLSNFVTALEKYSDQDPSEEFDKRAGSFRNATVEKVRDLINELPALNITNNKEINLLILDLKDKFPYDADMLRSDELARKESMSEAEKLLDSLSAWI